MSAFVLIHSPVVTPVTWQPVATALNRLGYVSVVPSLQGATPPYWISFADAVARAACALRHEPIILVAHSAAGLGVPLFGAAMKQKLVAGTSLSLLVCPAPPLLCST